jgi:methyl-accepting chemotaxis protein
MVILRGIQSERYHIFDDATKKAVDHVRNGIQPMVTRMKHESKIIQVSFIVSSICLIVFLLVIAVFFSRTIISPISRVSERSQQMAEGDFSQDAMQFRGRDEIGRMIDNFSAMSGKVGASVAHIKMSILSLTSSSEELSATAENLNKGAEEQARQTKQVTEATKQMSQTTMDIAQNTGQAADAAKNSSETATEGKKVVEMTAGRLATIRETVKDAMRTIEDLSQSSGQIGDIVNLIHGIADQTNLLALNAAIEAARAGEQGRGFAVVAEEVRKLADKTTSATKDIDKKISTIQSEAEKSLTTIRKGNDEIEKGMELARSASEALNSIVTASTKVMDMVQRVAAATEEQSATSEEITRNMNSISDVIEHSSSATGQIKQAAHGLATLATEIQSMTDWFKTNALTQSK